MSKCTELTREQLAETLEFYSQSCRRIAYYDVPIDCSSDESVTLPDQILLLQDGDYLALYTDYPAVSYQYLEDLLNDHAIDYGDNARSWLDSLKG